MTPVFCCGAECGVTGTTSQHWSTIGTTSISTGTVRNGSRSLRANPTAGTSVFLSVALTSNSTWVVRAAIWFTTLPNATTGLVITENQGCGAYFKSADNKIYPGIGFTLGSTGISVTTGQWYYIDVKIIQTTPTWSVDVSVNGVATTQLTQANATQNETKIAVGAMVNANTSDIFYDDIIISQTTADFPIGDGYVNHFISTSDGTHNVAGANDFERSATGTDITNATTTAFQLIDDVPLKSGVVSEYINLVAPPNATDYVEVIFGPAAGISTPTVAPRAVEVICAYASASAGTNNLRLALNDNGSLDDVLNTTTGPGTTAVYARKHYADPPSAASVWTLSGNGNFNNVRMRCFTSDAAPDPWWASAMIEAEFAPVVASIPNKIIQLNQSVNRASIY